MRIFQPCQNTISVQKNKFHSANSDTNGFKVKEIIRKQKSDSSCFAEGIVAFCLLFIGAFHEYISCIAAVAIIAWLGYQSVHSKGLTFYLNLTSVSILCAVALYGVSAFWAVDSGMALIGFAKYLPVLLYLLVLMQTENTNEILAHIPLIAAGMTLVSAIGMQIQALENYFSVAGRLSGFFQYPNTFAVFVLVAELLVFSKEKLRIFDFAIMAILLFGIFYSGSRTVFALAIVANIVLIFTAKSRKAKWFVAAVMAGFIAIAAVYTIVAGDGGALGRFLTISLSESTFVGRILYFKDALPLILKHPFGLGYMGYYYIQQSVQTGVYSVMFAHNDFLQLMLDVGWLPALLFVAAVARCIFAGKKPFYKRLILAVIVSHACFDFDLQFIGFFMLLLLFTDCKEGKKYRLQKCGGIYVAGISSALLCVYLGISLGLSHFGNYTAAFSIYPLDTRAETELLIAETDKGKSYKLADDIIRRNQYVTVAYSVKARQAYAKGDFKSLIQRKNKIFEKAPFAYDEYQEYCYMLITGYELYNEAGDTASAKVCMDELKSTVAKVHSIENKLSNLGKKIKDQPVNRLPDDIEKIAALGVSGD